MRQPRTRRLSLGITLALGSTVSGVSADVPSRTLSLEELDGVSGFTVTEVEQGGGFGSPSRLIGDINGDGFSDLLTHSANANPPGNVTGATYVVFGSDIPFPRSFGPDHLDGSTGFAIHGENPLDALGINFESGGDFNGDGINDLLIGATDLDAYGYNAGGAYVLFGRDGPFPPVVELGSLKPPAGVVFNAPDPRSYSGSDVGVAGDINGDGLDDIVIGSAGASPNGTLSGGAYVVFGKSESFETPFPLTSLNGQNGFRLLGSQASEEAGRSVSGGADINGDGLDDLVIGAELREQENRETFAYVVFGSEASWPSQVNLGKLTPNKGFTVSDNGDAQIRSVRVDDINGDSVGDLVLSLEDMDADDASAYSTSVIFGPLSPEDGTVTLTEVPQNRLLTIQGPYGAASATVVDDANGDSIQDVLVGGRRGQTPADFEFLTYLLFGQGLKPGTAVDLSRLKASEGLLLIPPTDLNRPFLIHDAVDFNGDGLADIVGRGRDATSGAGLTFMFMSPINDPIFSANFE